MVVIEFAAEKGKLIFEIDISKNNWCVVYIYSKMKKRLGAENFDTIRDKMINSLLPPYTTKKQLIDGIEVEAFTILNLVDSLDTILGTPTADSGLQLALLSSYQLLPFLELSKSEIDALCTLLKSLNIRRTE